MGGGRTLRNLLLRRRSRCLLLLLLLLLLRGFRAVEVGGELVSGGLERYLYCGIIMMNMRRDDYERKKRFLQRE